MWDRLPCPEVMGNGRISNCSKVGRVGNRKEVSVVGKEAEVIGEEARVQECWDGDKGRQLEYMLG